MWRSRGTILLSCLAVVPLLGCAGGPAATSRVLPPVPAAYAYYQAPAYPPPSVYRTPDAAPAAVLVVLPGAGAWSADPALWAHAGFDIVAPPPAAFYRLAAEEQQAMAQMLAEAERLADAPVWVMGPQQEIDAALGAPRLGEERISGIVETSSVGPAGACGESFSYFDPGTGAKPQVKVEKSGNCPPGGGFGIGSPGIAAPVMPATPAAPLVHPNAPRVIEASAAPENASAAGQRAAVDRLADLIKAAPTS